MEATTVTEDTPTHDRSPARLLAAAALGVYVLVVAGATAAIADAAAACGSWPVCEGPALGDTGLLVAWGHRLAAVVAGLLVVGATVRCWRRGSPRRVRAAATGALLLYPLQVAIGALAAVQGAPVGVAGSHLAVGVSIFAGVVVALAWQLEAETAHLPDPLDQPSSEGPEPEAPTPEPEVSAAEPGPASAEAAPSGATTGGLRATAGAYLRLTKPKLWWLLCMVAAAAMAIVGVPGEGLTVRTVVLTLVGGVTAIGAAGTFNHVLERDVDRRMQRTADRPLATDQVGVGNAVAFGVGLTLLSLALFAQVNLLAAALGLTAILFYSVVYTVVLKPNTVQNTVIGGAAGALPALIGSAAVTGRVGLPGLVLAGVIFLWTPAHFYNLAMAHRDDYERGGFPMLPVVRGSAVARKHVLWYLGATLVAAAVLTWLTSLGVLYAVATVALGAVFLWAVLRLHRERTEAAAMRAFHASNAYLGGLLLAAVVDALAV
jgi:protoheme IX farnesyltransferase